mmetsp:Transcript_10346/g.22108  ORF Transcript_10346/g.22108 Transcript_10346/m.22108 type:complete len:148 (+) Transcript_10346:724-1167(+)
MTVDCAPDGDINDANLRQEKTTSKRKSKSEQSSENEANGDDNEQKPELEQSLTITDMFGASFSNDKLSSLSSCSYSSSDEDADKDKHFSGDDGDNKDDGSQHQNCQDSKDKGIFDTALEKEVENWTATEDTNSDIRPDIQKLVMAQA